MTTPNRLETHWNELRPLILKKWNRLTESDLDEVDAEFDRLVELVKQRYDDPVITAKEAHIRQTVLDLLTEAEKNTNDF